MNQLDNNGIGTAQLESREHMMTYGLSSGISSQLLGSQAIDVVDVVGCLTSPRGTQLHEGHLAHLMSYIRACRDLEQHTPPNFVMHQSIGPVLNHYALSAEMSYSMRYPENAVTRGPQNILGFPKKCRHTHRERHTQTHVHTPKHRHMHVHTHINARIYVDGEPQLLHAHPLRPWQACPSPPPNPTRRSRSLYSLINFYLACIVQYIIY